MKYGIIFGSNYSNSKMTLTLQKRTVRIIAGVKSRNSCRNLFMILPFPCKYIFTLRNFVVSNQELFQTNSAIHSAKTKNRDHLHRPVANLSCFQKVHTMLASKPSTVFRKNLESLMNKKAQFKVALKRYINMHTFYSVEEFPMFLEWLIMCVKFFLAAVCYMDLV
jgi:hypothetical protein